LVPVLLPYILIALLPLFHYILLFQTCIYTNMHLFYLK
jgi:hypothetical protein